MKCASGCELCSVVVLRYKPKYLFRKAQMGKSLYAGLYLDSSCCVTATKQQVTSCFKTCGNIWQFDVATLVHGFRISQTAKYRRVLLCPEVKILTVACQCLQPCSR